MRASVAASSRVVFPAHLPRPQFLRIARPAIKESKCEFHKTWKNFYPEQHPEIVCHAVKSSDTEEQLDAAAMELISEISASAETYINDLVRQHSKTDAVGAIVGESTDLRKKVMKSIFDLQTGLLERETEVRLLLLAALCGEHLLLLGPPGSVQILISILKRNVHRDSKTDD